MNEREKLQTCLANSLPLKLAHHLLVSHTDKYSTTSLVNCVHSKTERKKKMNNLEVKKRKNSLIYNGSSKVMAILVVKYNCLVASMFFSKPSINGSGFFNQLPN